MICQMMLVKSDGTEVRPNQLMSFVFEKDAYTPYTRLSAEFLNTSDYLPTDCFGVKLYIGGSLVHFGMTDTYRTMKKNNCRWGTISSRGYTSMLTENQVPPGMYSDMTINKLFNSFCQLPNISFEKNNDLSYIYVRNGSSMWDAVTNLSYKLYGRYPYIKGANTVTMSQPDAPKSLNITSSEILEYGNLVDTRRLASDYHMQDVNGGYDTFALRESEAVNRKIVRYRYFDLDRRFLNDPILACEYRNMLAKSALRRRFLTYDDYREEDLYDRVTGSGITDKAILRIKITGNRKGIFTTLETEF